MHQKTVIKNSMFHRICMDTEVRSKLHIGTISTYLVQSRSSIGSKILNPARRRFKERTERDIKIIYLENFYKNCYTQNDNQQPHK